MELYLELCCGEILILMLSIFRNINDTVYCIFILCTNVQIWIDMHSNSLLQQGLHANVAGRPCWNHQHQHSSTQNPLRLPTKYAMAFGMVRRPAESAALRVWRVTWNHKCSMTRMTSSQRKRLPGYPNYMFVSHDCPQPSHDFFQASMKGEFPSTQKNICKKQHESHSPGFLAGNLAFKMAMAQSLCTKETRNIKYWWYWRYWKHGFWKHPSWGSMLLIHRQIHLTTDALTRPKVNKITAMLPNQTNLGASRQDGT